MACVEKIKHAVEHCNSDKGLQVFYDDGKNKFTGYCFSCASRGLEAYVEDPYEGKAPKPPKRKTEDEINEEIQEIRNLKAPRDQHRSIAPEYFARAGIKLAYSEYDGKTPFTFNFPYTVDGMLVGYKAIMLDKKAMWSIGSSSKTENTFSLCSVMLCAVFI